MGIIVLPLAPGAGVVFGPNVRLGPRHAPPIVAVNLQLQGPRHRKVGACFRTFPDLLFGRLYPNASFLPIDPAECDRRDEHLSVLESMAHVENEIPDISRPIVEIEFINVPQKPFVRIGLQPMQLSGEH